MCNSFLSIQKRSALRSLISSPPMRGSVFAMVVVITCCVQPGYGQQNISWQFQSIDPRFGSISFQNQSRNPSPLIQPLNPDQGTAPRTGQHHLHQNFRSESRLIKPLPQTDRVANTGAIRTNTPLSKQPNTPPSKQPNTPKPKQPNTPLSTTVTQIPATTPVPADEPKIGDHFYPQLDHPSDHGT